MGVKLLGDMVILMFITWKTKQETVPNYQPFIDIYLLMNYTQDCVIVLFLDSRQEARMTKDNWQKVKLLKMMDMLRTESSPEHPLTTENICSALISQGINCDRKTPTKDVQTLRNYGYEVGVKQIGHEKGYYVPEKKGDFTLTEQKIIIDALQAVNFITRDKTDELITKVAEFNMEQKEHILATSVVCFNKRKHSNEEIYANVRMMEDALSQRMQVSFVYFDRNENGRESIARNGSVMWWSLWH